MGFPFSYEAQDISVPCFFYHPLVPFITSGIDLAKLDMRSGMEGLTYALIIVLVATMSAWIMAMLLHLQPVDFIKIRMSVAMWILTRLLCKLFGVFGFSIMFNSQSGLPVLRQYLVQLQIPSVLNWWIS